MRTAPTARPGVGGLSPHCETVVAINRAGAISKGYVGILDLAYDDADVADNAEDGGTDSGFGNVIAISDTYGSSADGTKPQATGIFVVALEDAVDDAEAEWGIMGIFDVAMDGSGNAIAKDDPLIVDAATPGKVLEVDGGTATQAYKVVAKALSAETTDTTARALFDGLNGFGTFVA